MSNRIVEEIRELSVSKSLNILIGSGCSVGDKIGLMSQYWQEAKEENPGASEEQITESGNKKLLDAVIKASEEILKYPADFQKVKGNEDKVYTSYCEFVLELVNLLERSNSRQTPKNVNIFTTNYDLYIEKSVDSISRIKNFVFNDGTKGYFERILDGSSYNRLVSYKGLSDNYIDEIPSISLIKPHGSVNWKKIHAPDSDNYSVSITNYVNKEKDKQIFVPPTGYESQDTFLNNHFHEMLRIFQMELDKPQSVLLVVGFSFQDEHIAKMVTRALKNPELKSYIFCYSNDNESEIVNNLGGADEKKYRNLKLVTPKNFSVETDTAGSQEFPLGLSAVTNILKKGSLN
ncbi:SIR2 family protein [Rothia sp. HMSC071F11]|jgi:hypothetical protein|uniref:SIR2 family protein n=1 Tax=Rothia sp. HMSC071F11 TaxID=1715034 RepID=UPI0008A27808|nr:SIR2 family protein [Rothia sp. HMSC071F11]OFN49243.1 hypothetical protein HMPREF2554_06215 [Rothia sp. HMSC071F11]